MRRIQKVRVRCFVETVVTAVCLVLRSICACMQPSFRLPRSPAPSLICTPHHTHSMHHSVPFRRRATTSLIAYQELQNLGYAEGKKAPKPAVLAKQAEFFKWGRVCQIGDSASPDDVTKWTVMIRGPTPDIAPSFPAYAGAVFKVRIEFPPTYPFKMPKFTFIADAEASIPFHPNVTPAGEMCQNLIIGGVDWKGTMDSFFVLSNIYALLAAPSLSDVMSESSSATPYEVFTSAAAGAKDAALATFCGQAQAACRESFSPATEAAFAAVAVPFLDASIAR